MVRSRIVLADGTEIFSGMQEEYAITRAELTQRVNEGQDLRPGAVCPDVLEIELCVSGSTVTIPIDSELNFYQGKSEESWEFVGLFTVGNTVWLGPNRYRITAYDRLSWLDRDMSDWIESLDAWPYRLDKFAQMVCQACNLELAPGYFTNGEWPVHQFSGNNVTGRKLMRWVGEISRRFCRVSPQGEISLEWYKEINGDIWTEEKTRIFKDSFSSADYLTAVIDKVIVRAETKDSGTSYGSGGNAYISTGNLLVTSVPEVTLREVARVLYEQLHGLQYNPGTLAVPADTRIQCGDILRFMNENGRETVMYVMKKTQRGQKAILECIGNPYRNGQTVKSGYGAVAP